MNIGMIEENFRQFEYVIIGGGLAALPLAQSLARSGRSVLVTEASTSLCYEISRYYRPWTADSQVSSSVAKRWFPGALAGEYACKGEIPLHMDSIKLEAENRLQECGVRLLYNVQLAYAKRSTSEWSLVFAGKGGLFSVTAQHLIDCTEQCIAMSLLETELLAFACEPRKSVDNLVYRTVEFTGVSPSCPHELSIPEDLPGACGRPLLVHRGAHSGDHAFIEIPLRIPSMDSLERSPDHDSRMEAEARRLSLEQCAYLVSKVEELSGAQICLASGMVLRREPKDPMEVLAEAEAFAAQKDILSQYGDRCLCVGNKRGTAGRGNWSGGSIDTSTEVCVGGGGPSGASAALAAANEGSSVLLAEFNDELGGTGTSGAVRWYWYGMRRGFTERINRHTDAWQSRLGWKKQPYVWGMNDGWAVEAKSMAYLELCQKAGVRVLFGCLVVGVLKKGKTVTGVQISTPYGMMQVSCSVAVDATGDGDIAAYAGARYQQGNDRDRMAMWGSMAPLQSPSNYSGNYSTSVDSGDVIDRTRFILSERRRWGKAGVRPIDHASYLASRESRHIKGGYTITLYDQLLQRRYPDTVMVAFSNNDPKGISQADIMNIGLLPPNLHIHVPYRAIIPENIDGIIIAGRALSCTHDANCAVRMQDDMQMLGGAAGVAAAMCARSNIMPRDLDVTKLQQRLVELNSFSFSEIEYRDNPQAQDLAGAIEQISGEDGMSWAEQNPLEYTAEPLPVAVVCSAKSERAIPVLKSAKAKLPASPARLLISRLLVYHGCEDGLDEILAQIEADLSACILPQRAGSFSFAQVLPDHNMMPETAFLFHNLAFCPSKRVLPVFKKLTGILCNSERDYSDNRKGIFYYIRSIAYAAERLCFPGFIPLLHKLLGLPELAAVRDHAFVEPSLLPERHAYLELLLYMALARCGDLEGYLGLCRFLKDSRSLLRRSASDELHALTRCEHGFDAAAWESCIRQQPHCQEPKPWTLRIL